jgi:hypothetical protein
MELNDEELVLANALVNSLEEGPLYKLSEIYGEKWNSVQAVTTFGKKFLNSVIDKKVKNLEFIKKESDNHALYKKTNVYS